MAFDIVKRVKVLDHILKHFLGVVDDAIWMGQKSRVRRSILRPPLFLSAAVANDDTSVYVEAGDVSGGFLIVGRKAFIVLRSLAVLLSRLSPPGAGSRPQNAQAYIYTQHWCKKKTHNLLLILQQNWGNPRMCGFRSKTVVGDIPPSFSFRYPPLTPLLLVRCTVATECVEIRSHDGFIWKRKRKCYN